MLTDGRMHGHFGILIAIAWAFGSDELNCILMGVKKVRSAIKLCSFYFT